jgi:peptide/nickel transport system permease protein
MGHAVRGQLGVSLASHEPVATLIGQCLPVTVELAVAALILTVILGIALGILCAVMRGSWVDSTVRIVSLIWISIPNFVFGIVLVLVFGWYFSGILPYEQWVPLTQSVGGNISHLVLPAVALALGPIGIIARLTRLSMLEVLSRDYIMSARAFGIRTVSILFVDALKNAALPVLAALGTITAFLLGGTVPIETVFNLPGLGSLLTSSLTGKDFPVVSGALLVLSLIIILVNILVDLLYGIMNPRIAARYSGVR